ncbi:MAG TPA: hypothetical protein VFR20_01490 [Burkholderiaceae bacterium]|nr:hypothetical protein [Burkholderiaceae bacterium]
MFPLYAILAVCIAPVVLAWLAYYFPSLGLRPSGTTNYGTFVQPQRPIPPASALALTTLDGKPFDLSSLKGKWILLTADQGACPKACVRKLFILRNAHASQGKNVERLTRVWFVTDDAPVPADVLKAYGGTHIVRAKPAQLAAFLAPRAGTTREAALRDPMWVIDPLGHLMLRFPANADPISVRDDLKKLLHNSQIG